MANKMQCKQGSPAGCNKNNNKKKKQQQQTKGGRKMKVSVLTGSLQVGVSSPAPAPARGVSWRRPPSSCLTQAMQASIVSSALAS
uniref:Uncharacterized protein n=1 Tax=Oryza rufipogon TaxID=4529 RepID=A0A0E0P418_ORYRU